MMKTVPLPVAPRNASPVSHLTSIHAVAPRGHYGNARYPGNCGGYLIRDLLQYFKPKRVFDPMSGSGTCRDVCQELGIEVVSADLHSGFDCSHPKNCDMVGEFDFVWIHPPYWRMKVYSNDPRDLSAARDLPEFLRKLSRVIVNCKHVLAPGGHLAILMGDYHDREIGFVPLTYHTKRLCFNAGLIQDCTDIVRFQHGNSSSSKTYKSTFIPGLHDICLIVKQQK
ncbi:DNA methylase [Gimesia aquarii]|uniref:DNA methylase n=2 Tax=Gimesia aquarii TaxID=2527964 RepID=A0A517X042_9PLAN|nr:DNA methylase [Gimesia aquarii]